MAEDQQTIHGRKACQALFKQRPEAIRRIFYRREGAQELGDMLRWAAARKLVYREVSDDELAKLAKTNHHEGLVLVTNPMRFRRMNYLEAGQSGLWLGLDRVENPHNLGAILRTAAFFGLNGVVVGGVSEGEKVNGAAIRVAQGGAEHLAICAEPDLPSLLHNLVSEGWQVMGLETGGESLATVLPATRPWMLVAGHEAYGLGLETRQACGQLVTIPGAGAVGSLNVSVAVGVALGLLVGS